MSKWVLASASMTIFVAAVHAATPAAYPNRPIRLVVAVAAGGGTDIVSRLLATRMTESLGQNVIVDNRGGGNFIIGTQIVAKAPPDGYTLVTATNASHAINPGLFRDLPYDPIKDFTPIVALAGVPVALTVLPTFPAKTLQEFITYAKQNDGKLTHGSSGTGGTGHLTAEIFKSVAGFRAVHVPYKSDGPALVDLLGGQISFMVPNLPPIVPHVKAGRLRSLAMSSARRSPVLPDVPTFLENGVKVEVLAWYCIMGPAGLPQPIVARLNTEINKIIGQPEFVSGLTALGATPIGGPPGRVTEMIRSDMAKYAKAIRDSGARAD